MENQKNDTDNYLGSFIIMVLLLLFVISDKSNNHSSLPLKAEVASGYIQYNPCDIIPANRIPSIQMISLNIIIKSNLVLYTNHNRIFADNRKTAQTIILLQKTRHSI